MEILIIFIFTLVNGFFALSEIALVSVKKNKIQHLAAQGSRRAKTILTLLENPDHFLSSTQVGITLIGIISGAYGGATLTDDMQGLLSSVEFIKPFAPQAALIIVIGGITYFTIVIGELVPKTIAMNHTEKIALFCAPIVSVFTKLTFPFVKLLSFSTQLILKLLGVKDVESDKVSEEELRFMLKTANTQGVLDPEESWVHQNLFAFNDQTAKSLMTHSSEVEWIDCNDNKQIICENLKKSVHSKFIVSDNALDNIQGIVSVKDFLENYLQPGFDLKNIIREPLFITVNTPAFKVLNLFKTSRQYMGVVVDEYGSIKGIVTLHDLFEGIIGDLPDDDEPNEPSIVKRSDGSYLMDGQVMIFELNQYFQRDIIEDSPARYTTISGYILDSLKSIPKEGEEIKISNLTFEIMDMDGFRIDKVLMTQEVPQKTTKHMKPT